MRAGIDAQLAVGTATGIGEYVLGLVPALRAHGVDVVELSQPRLDPWRFDRRVIWDQIVLPRAADRERIDVLHCAAGTMPLRASVPIVVTVHDVAWLRHQEHARPYARWYFGDFALRRYRGAAQILTDSAFSKAELIALSGIEADRIAVAYPGVARDFAQLERQPRDPPTVLAVGTVEPRKNLAVAIRAIAPLEGVRLISVGPPASYLDECRQLVRSLGIADRVEFRGYVDRAELVRLYQTCTVAVAPSTYEGFGYAAAQALCAAVPLIASNASSLPEIVAGDAPLVDPRDAYAWTDALRSLLDDRAAQERAAQVRARNIERFTWESAARTIAATYAAAYALYG